MLETVIIVGVVAVVVLAAGVAWWFENGSASHMYKKRMKKSHRTCLMGHK